MFSSSADKILKTTPAVQQKSAGNNFFRKAGENSFFCAKENPSFLGKPLQAKLTVSTPDDPHEKEADAVADKVMRMQEPVMASPLAENKEKNLDRKEEEEVQTKSESPVISKIQCKENPPQVQAKSENIVHRSEEKHVDAKHEMGAQHNGEQTIGRKNISLYQSDIMRQSGSEISVSPIPFEQTLSSSKGLGSALPNDTRTFMESRFNADFSGVRIHTDATAQKLSRSVNAQAFAHGNDIYFSSGKFAPDSTEGGTLLAHELTHTVQQGAIKTKNISRSNAASVLQTKPSVTKQFAIAKKTISSPTFNFNNSHTIISPSPQITGSGQGHGHQAASATVACPRGIRFSTGNFPVHVPLCGMSTITATTAPANIPGINWTITAGTATVGAGTTIGSTGNISIGATQTAGTLRVTAGQPAVASGGTCSSFIDLSLLSHPIAINSTVVVGPPPQAARNYGAVFNHNFASADGNVASIENVAVGEEFSALPNPTGTTHEIPGTPFGSFTLSTANLTNTATNNWFINAGMLNGTFDNVTFGRAGVDVGRFLQSASNLSPASILPAGFTVVQGLHWFCRQAPPGSRWTRFANVNHTRTLRLDSSGTGLEFLVSVNGQDNVNAYTGPPGIINARASLATIPLTPAARKGTPAPVPVTSTIAADSRPDPMPAGHVLRYRIHGAAHGCKVNATTGVFTPGHEVGTIKVRVSDSDAANANFDEVTVRIIAPPAPAKPAQPGTAPPQASPGVAPAH